MIKQTENGFIKFEDLILHSRRAAIIFLEIILGVFTSIFLAKFFLEISERINKSHWLWADEAVAEMVYSWRTPELTEFMKTVTNLGAGYILIILAIITLVLILEKHKKESVLFGLTFGMGVVANYLLKFFFQRPRPVLDPLIEATNYSFPSGHAMNSTIFYGLLAFYIFHFTRKKLASLVMGIVCGLIIILIGFSRVYLGVHYPSDVIAGFVVGGWWLVTTLLMEKTLVLLGMFEKQS